MAIRNASTLGGAPMTSLTVSSGASTMNCALNDNFTISPTTDVVITPSNIKADRVYRLRILTSGYTTVNIMFASPFKSKGVYRTTKSSGVGDILEFYSDGTNLYEAGNRNFSLYTPANEPEVIRMYEADYFGSAPQIAQTDNTSIANDWLDWSASAVNGVRTGSPEYQTNEINGRPIVKLRGDTYGDYFALGNLSGLTAGAIYIVWKVTQSDNGGNMFGTGSGVSSHYPYNTNDVYDDFGSTTRRNVANSAWNVWHIYYAYSRPNDWAVYQNTTSIMSSNTNTVAFTSTAKLGDNLANLSMLAEIQGVYLLNDKPDLITDKRIRDYIKTRTNL